MGNWLANIIDRLADEIGNFEEVLNRLHPDCQLRDITRIPLA